MNGAVPRYLASSADESLRTYFRMFLKISSTVVAVASVHAEASTLDTGYMDCDLDGRS